MLIYSMMYEILTTITVNFAQCETLFVFYFIFSITCFEFLIGIFEKLLDKSSRIPRLFLRRKVDIWWHVRYVIRTVKNSSWKKYLYGSGIFLRILVHKSDRVEVFLQRNSDPSRIQQSSAFTVWKSFNSSYFDMSSEFWSEKKLISFLKNSVFIYFYWQEMFTSIKFWDFIGIPGGKAAEFPYTSLFDGIIFEKFVPCKGVKWYILNGAFWWFTITVPVI